MDVPLGRNVGNALEVIESIETLKGRGPQDLEWLSVRLAARMLVLGGIVSTTDQGERRVREAIASGAGVETFRKVVEWQGGDPRVVDDYTVLGAAPRHHVVLAKRNGFLDTLDAEMVGRATMVLGAGRETVADAIDPTVGAVLQAAPGDQLRAGDPILTLHYRDETKLPRALTILDTAITLSDQPPPQLSLLLDTVP
jgi:thymidine phosphorylase